MWPHPQETADLVTFTEEILNGKLHFLWSALYNNFEARSYVFSIFCDKAAEQKYHTMRYRNS